ncbi:unnamed protein product, partial [Choristocarpus tenellus]
GVDLVKIQGDRDLCVLPGDNGATAKKGSALEEPGSKRKQQRSRLRLPRGGGLKKSGAVAVPLSSGTDFMEVDEPRCFEVNGSEQSEASGCDGEGNRWNVGNVGNTSGSGSEEQQDKGGYTRVPPRNLKELRGRFEANEYLPPVSLDPQNPSVVASASGSVTGGRVEGTGKGGVSVVALRSVEAGFVGAASDLVP